MNSGDTAWLLTSTALVLLMTPALAFFYGGMVRRKNLLSTIMMSFAILCMISILWVLYGYTLAFGPDVKGLLGDLSWFGLTGVGQDPSPVYASTVPQLAFVAFQATFAIITVALWTGAVVERIKFGALLAFAALWFTLVYCPVAHWVWGSGGWLVKLGALDFAGGTVVHVNAGISALALALVLGPRMGFKEGESMEPNNIPYVVLGAALLWFGWFGFNAGSALTAGGACLQRFHCYQYCGCGGRIHLDDTWLDPSPSLGAGRSYRRGGGTGGHYTGRRFRACLGRDPYRRNWRRHLLLRDGLEGKVIRSG